jgi:hypothetical protein
MEIGTLISPALALRKLIWPPAIFANDGGLTGSLCLKEPAVGHPDASQKFSGMVLATSIVGLERWYRLTGGLLFPTHWPIASRWFLR